MMSLTEFIWAHVSDALTHVTGPASSSNGPGRVRLRSDSQHTRNPQFYHPAFSAQLKCHSFESQSSRREKQRAEGDGRASQTSDRSTIGRGAAWQRNGGHGSHGSSESSHEASNTPNAPRVITEAQTSWVFVSKYDVQRVTTIFRKMIADSWKCWRSFETFMRLRPIMSIYECPRRRRPTNTCTADLHTLLTGKTTYRLK